MKPKKYIRLGDKYIMDIPPGKAAPMYLVKYTKKC